MVVRTAADQMEPFFHHSLCKRFRILHHLLLIRLKFRLQRFSEADCLCSDDVHKRPALGSGEDCLVNGPGMLFLAQNNAASWPPQRLVGGTGYHVCIWNRALVQACGNQTGDMRHIHEQIGSCFFCNIGKDIKPDLPGIRRGPCNNHLRLTLLRLSSDLVIIQKSFVIYIIWYKVIQKPGHIHR